MALALCVLPAPALADWSDGPALDGPVHGAAAAEAGGLVYVGGGEGLLAPQQAFSVLDIDASEWTALEGLPFGLSGHAMAALDGAIYVAGGETRRAPEPDTGGRAVEIGLAQAPEGPSANVWAYDIGRQTWREAPPMPAPRSGFALTTLDGRLYASGGGRLIAFDPRDGAWMDLGPEPAGAGRAAAATDGRLYLIGGGAPGGAANAPRPGVRVDIYDPAEDRWSRGPDLPSPRFDHAVVTANGAIHVLGGRDADGETLDEHLVLGGNGWTVAEPLQSPRAGAAAAALPDGRIVLVGGGFAGGFFAAFTALDTVDIYESSSR